MYPQEAAEKGKWLCGGYTMKLQKELTLYTQLPTLLSVTYGGYLYRHEATIRSVLAMPTKQHCNHSVNSSDSKKSAILSDTLEHLQIVKMERSHLYVRHARIACKLTLLFMASTSSILTDTS